VQASCLLASAQKAKSKSPSAFTVAHHMFNHTSTHHIDTADDYRQDLTSALVEIQREERHALLKQTEQAAIKQEQKQLAEELEIAQKSSKDSKQQKENLQKVTTSSI
jgi:glycyl-tRNA synthetase beta subunit